MELAAGTRLGPYEIVSPLGAGGMGEVYVAADVRLGRKVALKILPERFAGDRDLLLRFDREARSASALNHQNIVVVHDVGVEGSVSYIAMELIDGVTLATLLDQGPIPLRRVLSIAIQVASGLRAAHAHGIVHRDLKPSNVMVTTDDRVKILDFGLAKTDVKEPITDGTTQWREPATTPGAFLGTGGYSSPEQVRGLPADERSDIFSFGCLLFEMVTGKRAFAGRNAAESLAATLRDTPCDPRQFANDTPRPLCEVIKRCLQKDPLNRFQTVHDLSFALEMIAAEIDTPEQSSSRPSAAPEKRGVAPTLAVLPFVNMSSEKENEYFSDGMTEEIISALTKVEGLRVASRTSVFAFKSRSEDVRHIGQRLSVATVLEGSVRKSGDRLRITAQLISVDDGYHLWSETYDRRLDEVFALQDEIARTIVDTLKVRLGLDVQHHAGPKRHTESAEAYNLYLKGRHYWARRSEEDERKGIEYFEKALEIDPDYARAYAGIADCLLSRCGIGQSPRETMPRARAAAMKAIDLDPTVAEARAALARVMTFFDWDWLGAEREYRLAIALDPRYAESYHGYSHLLLPIGRVADSLAVSNRAADLEPNEVTYAGHLGWHYMSIGAFDSAERHLLRALSVDPLFLPAHTYLGVLLEQKGALTAAIDHFEKARSISPTSTEALGGLAHALGTAGRSNDARVVLDQMLRIAREHYVSAFDLVFAWLGSADVERALVSLERAVEERSMRITELLIDPRLGRLASDHRFQAAARRIGLTARS